MQAKFDALLYNEIWTLVLRPKNMKVLGSKWVFRVNKLSIIFVEKHKSRVMAKKFHQIFEFDFKETFNPVVKHIISKSSSPLLSLEVGSSVN